MKSALIPGGLDAARSIGTQVMTGGFPEVLEFFRCDDGSLLICSCFYGTRSPIILVRANNEIERIEE